MNSFSMEELVPLLQEVIRDGGEFRLYPRGTSMRPLLREGIDSVALVTPPPKRRRGEILLYRRANGQYVLHRLVAFRKDGALCFCGDNQRELEWGITEENVIASVCAVYRGEKRRGVTRPLMWIYAQLMTVGFVKAFTLFARRALAKLGRRA